MQWFSFHFKKVCSFSVLFQNLKLDLVVFHACPHIQEPKQWGYRSHSLASSRGLDRASGCLIECIGVFYRVFLENKLFIGLYFSTLVMLWLGIFSWCSL